MNKHYGIESVVVVTLSVCLDVKQICQQVHFTLRGTSNNLSATKAFTTGSTTPICRYSGKSVSVDAISFMIDSRDEVVLFDRATKCFIIFCYYKNRIKTLYYPKYFRSTERFLSFICLKGNGSKRTNLNKIGRFGVGINTQFHITDAIQFISNDKKYVILDPLCQHFPNLDLTNPGRRIDVTTLAGQYPDIISGFKLGTMPLEASTMFRFSLRSSKPRDLVKFLSTQVTSAAEMQQMMLDFAKTAYETSFSSTSARSLSTNWKPTTTCIS